MNNNNPVVNMLWIGPTLGRIELLSIASWQSAGHTVRLHTYDSVRNVPSSVEVLDGTLIAPFELMQKFRHGSTGSFALASDYFRYKLQQCGAGLWSDLDVVCLKPIATDGGVVFGMEDDERINGAILYLDKNLPMTNGLIDLFADNFIPPWTRRTRARKLRFKSFFGYQFTAAHMPWGTYGPEAISELAHKHGLFERASPVDVFYPLHYLDAKLIFDSGFSLDSIVTERTLAVHLWNEALRDFKNTNPPRGSPLAKLFWAHGV